MYRRTRSTSGSLKFTLTLRKPKTSSDNLASSGFAGAFIQEIINYSNELKLIEKKNQHTLFLNRK